MLGTWLLGSSTVPATGSFRWQYNASNGAVFVGISARILVCIGTAVVSFVVTGVCGRTGYITFVHTFQHWQFFLYACGAVGRQ